MQKINFKNLPDTSTPLNASTLNTLQDNIEDCFEGNTSMGSIIVENIKCKNMINKDTFTLSYTYGSDGVWTFNDKNAISDYIEIENNKPYTISSISSPTVIVVHYFNSSKQWQERTAYQNVNEIHITNTNNYPYIRISFNYDDTTTVTQSIIDSMRFQVEEGNIHTDYIEHKEFNNKQIYSENEIKIGTWIDGKDLYRKTIKYTNAIQQNTITTIGTLGGQVDIVASITFIITNSAQSEFFTNSYISGTTSKPISVTVIKNSGDVTIKSLNETWSTPIVLVTVEYTKTTN